MEIKRHFKHPLSKLTIMLLMALLPPQVATAYDFKDSNFCYQINEDGKSVTLTYDEHEKGNLIGEIVIPSSVSFNGKRYFVTAIGVGAFEGCSRLTGITISKSIEEIQRKAFYGCDGITSITVEPENKVFDSRDNCNAIIRTADNALLKGCKNTIIPSSVTALGGNAFDGCTGLTKITIPSSITSIDGGAFRGCTDLSSIIVEENNEVYDSRNNCNAIIKTADNTLIAGCNNTTIPNSVKTIDIGAFDGCAGLMSITIPKSVTEIKLWAFVACSGLTSIIVEDGNNVYDSRENCNAIIETYSNTLIAGCKNTTIPPSVINIGSWAFSNCASLTNITIPQSVRKISDLAFSHCTGLTSITIPKNVESIKSDAFRGCTNLISIIVEKGNKEYDSRNNCNAIIKTYSNTLIAGCKNTIIPPSVTSIEASAFADCTGLTSIIIPKSVTNIGLSAFEGCIGLTSIHSQIENPSNCEMLNFVTFAVFKGVDKEKCTLYVPKKSVNLYKNAEQWSDFKNIKAETGTSTTQKGNKGTKKRNRRR